MLLKRFGFIPDGGSEEVIEFLNMFFEVSFLNLQSADLQQDHVMNLQLRECEHVARFFAENIFF